MKRVDFERDDDRKRLEELRREDPEAFLELLARQGLREDLVDQHREIGGEGGGA